MLDSGNFLFKKKIVSERDNQQKVTAQGILKIYQQMEYTAINVGPYDTAMGLNFITNTNSLPLVSCNFFNHSGDSVFKQSIVTTIDSMKVGITGVTSRPQLLENNYIFKEWQTSLPGVIESLRLSADFIILLSSLSEKENKVILEQYPQIRLLISAIPKRQNQPPKHINQSIICQTANQGKYLGVLKIENALAEFADDAADEAINQLERQLRTLKHQIDTLRNQPTLENKNKLRALTEDYEKKASSLRMIGKDKDLTSDEPLANYDIRFIPLSTNLPEDEHIDKLVDEIKNNIKSSNMRKSKSFKNEQLFFGRTRNLSGPERCRQCHPIQYEFWKSTSHSTSMESLKEKKQDRNGDCLPCHITQDPEHFILNNNDVMMLFRDRQDLNLIGCEACHGVGKNHSENNNIKMKKKVSANTCLLCHTPERDDTFNFEVKRQIIACPPL